MSFLCELFYNKQNMQPKTIVSSKKITLSSQFLLFDLLPIKKYHQCNVRIPQTILLQKGYIKDWLFNSRKDPNHSILKKKRENMSPLSVVKTFCNKFGYYNVTHHCTTVGDVKDAVKAALKEQKDYDFVKDKKVIEVTTITNEVLSMSLLSFLEFSAQNKYSDQSFYEKWKMIQEKVSFTKIDEYYSVENVRHNHVIESKCQKIISVNTTQLVSTQMDDDNAFKKTLPNRNFDFAQTKNMQGYKFFDTFLNKKFFKMSNDLVEFIEKNFKCLVESLRTKFVINKERQPHLVGIYDLEIKPAKKIADMRDFQIQKEKGYLKMDEYVKFLQIYISENFDKFGHVHYSQSALGRKKACKGKFCRTPIQDVALPPILEQKLKLPSLSANARITSEELRDAVVKRQRKVIELLKENQIIKDSYDLTNDSSSEYETSDSEDHFHKTKAKQIKICHNCFLFYFHVNRFFELDNFGNLAERKVPLAPSRGKTASEKKLPSVENLQKKESEKPITSQNLRKTESIKNLVPIKHLRGSRSTKTLNSGNSRHEGNSTLQLNKTSVKQKLEPITENRAKFNELTEKSKTLMKISKNPQIKTSNLRKPMLQTTNWQKRPQNYSQAVGQIIKKLSKINHSNKGEFIYYAKKYFKDNLPQPIERRSFSSFYFPHLYEFMSNTPISISQRQRIKKRPEMSLKRLSELTDYPEIVSKSEFLFDTLIVNEQTTIPFCVITTKIVNPDNIKSGVPFENIFFVNDIFDSFIEYISVAKELLEDDESENKRIILFNYPGQSHTIYNEDNIEAISVNFGNVMDKLLYRLSSAKGELKLISLKNDSFKFCGFGYGAYLLSSYLGAYHYYFPKLNGVLLINGFMEMPIKYKEMLDNLLVLFSSGDPTVQEESYLFYNKAIHSSQTDRQELQHKAGLNPIRVQDRQYLLKSAIWQYQESKTRSFSTMPISFENVNSCQVTSVYGRSNAVLDKESSQQFETYRNNKKVDIPKRVFLQISAGHDTLADNYEDMIRILTLFVRK